MSEWTDELKAEVIKDYKDAEPTAESSTEIVAEIAEKIGKTPNGVRMILSKAGVYVSKASAPAAKKEGGEKKAGAAGTRVSKEAAHAALTKAIEAAGKEADEEIISKLTGKAAQYFTGLFK